MKTERLKGLVLVLVLFAHPAHAFDYETTLTLDNPIEEDGIIFDRLDEVVFHWSSEVEEGAVNTAQVDNLAMIIHRGVPAGACSGGPGLCTQIYFDRIIVDGVVQDMPGTERDFDDVFWDFDLDSNTLRQFRNVGSDTVANTEYEQYLVEDNLTLPADGIVRVARYQSGNFDGFGEGSLIEQETVPGSSTNIVVEPACCVTNGYLASLTHGWQFVADENVEVTALGWSDPEQDGFVAPHDVALFRAGEEIPLRETQITSASELDRAYRYNAIDPITLQAGETYIIAGFDRGEVPDVGLDRYAHAPLAESEIDPRITYQGYLSESGEALELPGGVPNPQIACCARWPTNMKFASEIEAPFAPIISYTPNPELPNGSNPIEGDFVYFNCSDTEGFDPESMICSWEMSSGSLGLQQAEGQIVIFAFPDDDFIQVELTVSDGEALASTTANVRVDNGAPLVNALNVEVPVGGTGEAVCRYADPGARDNHEVFFDLGGAIPLDPQDAEEENQPSLSSGFGMQKFSVAGIPAGTVLEASCSVSDGLDSGLDAFTISVLSAAEVVAKEVADSGSSVDAPAVEADNEVIGVLDTPSDIDVFEITTREGLKPGGEFVLNLKVPTDYDLIVFRKDTSPDQSDSSPFVNAPFVNAPFVNAPFVNVPFVNVPFVNAPFVNAPFVNAPFVNAPFVNVPFVNAPFVNAPFVNAPLNSSPFIAAGFEFQDFPLSQVGLAAPDGGNISGSDVGLDELGSANLGALLGEGLQVMMFSAQPGAAAERLLVKVTPGTDKLFAAIVSNSGAAAVAPYSLRVEASVPPSQEQILGDRWCVRDPLVAEPTGEIQVLHAQGNPRTLIVTQRERLMAAYGLSGAQFDQFMLDLAPFLNHDKVMAEVISVPGNLYQVADSNQCRVDEQNEVSRAIREIIEDRVDGRPVEYIQLMGSANIIPPRYSPDETSVGYEALFVQDLLTQPGRPIAVAFAEGNNITDAYYGDFAPVVFRGRELPLEDISVSRMVETPAEILAAADAFVTSNGVIPLNNTLAAGYDFFEDGTRATSAIFDTISPNNNDELISATGTAGWKGDDLRCGYLDNADSTVPFCPVTVPAAAPDLAAVNFHASYNAGLSAFGFNNFSSGATAQEIIRATEAGMISPNGLTLSIGCHSGLSVPDPWALPDNIGLPFDPALDWVQQPGSWIGPWNYGLGDNTVADRGTEGLITLVAEELAQGATLGNALRTAKLRYAVSVFEFDVHDEKSVIGLALFGMPQAVLDAPPNPPPPVPPVIPNAVPAGTLDLIVGESNSEATTSETFDYQAATTNNGVYYPLAGKVQGVVGRPLLPAATPVRARPVPAGTSPIHDVIIRGGTFVDLPDVDPVFAFPQQDWAQDVVEPQACVETFSPSQLGIATSIQTGPPGATQILESLIVLGAQFKCTTPANVQNQTDATGTLRKFDSLNIEAQRPSDLSPLYAADFDPPVVLQQQLTVDAATGNVTATLDVSDTSGMREIIALIYRSTGVDTGIIESASTGILAGPGPYQLILPNAAGIPLAFQYVDNAGNVLLKTGKGLLLQPLVVDIVTADFVAGANVEVVIDLPGAANLTDPELTLDFSDGTFDTFTLFDAAGGPSPGVTLDVDGNARVRVMHDYSGYALPTATVTVTARGNGAEGFDATTIDVAVLAGDINIDGQVDIEDVRLITAARGQTVPPANPAMDLDGDGVITVNDARSCVLLCANPRCAP